MTTSDPKNEQQRYLPPTQPPTYAAPGAAAPGYAEPGYSAPGYGGPGMQYVQAVPGPGEPFDGALNPDDLSRPLYGATFSQAIRRFFKQYANFTGRASRSEFWWSMLFMALVNLVPAILTMIGGMSATFWAIAQAQATTNGSAAEIADAVNDRFMFAPTIGLLTIGGSLIFLVSLAFLVPQLALYWRRLHDVNLAGPFYFLSFIAVGSIVVFVFTLLGPKPQGRRFQSSQH